MTLVEVEHLTGSHHYRPLMYGLPDDGFGNALYRESKLLNTVVGIGVLQKLAFLWSDQE